ncbi:hypothetical protein LOY64_22710 [Pseudomonas corrugata]|uniref:hypothetical protein n=1 Tax=Pseudomonas corrugata TaxID=47879 RepID=UPI0022320A3F|nr:hypothetical protein [Pseudomonas corrugata]UZD94092.1 hypothetical protein LOY64_22710 [Pseudomonas corrugata]
MKPYILLDLSADRRKRKRQLRNIDTTVPLRSQGRTTDHTEIYSIVWMLRIAPPLQLTYPLQVIHDDRPDFVLSSVGIRVGVEVTEAVSANTASMDNLRETELGLTEGHSTFYFQRKATPGEDKINCSILREMIRENTPGEPWVGTGAEDWAAAISYFVSEKVVKSGKLGFRQYDLNWLLIYDNWDEPALRQDLADEALFQHLQAMAAFDTFDRVLVLDGQELASFTAIGNQRWRRPW